MLFSFLSPKSCCLPGRLTCLNLLAEKSLIFCQGLLRPFLLNQFCKQLVLLLKSPQTRNQNLLAQYRFVRPRFLYCFVVFHRLFCCYHFHILSNQGRRRARPHQSCPPPTSSKPALTAGFGELFTFQILSNQLCILEEGQIIKSISQCPNSCSKIRHIFFPRTTYICLVLQLYVPDSTSFFSRDTKQDVFGGISSTNFILGKIFIISLSKKQAPALDCQRLLRRRVMKS